MLRPAQPGEQAMPHLFTRLHGQLKVFKNSMAVENGRALKLPADAGQGDFVFRELRQVQVIAEKHRAGIRSGLAGDDVQQGGFTGSVGGQSGSGARRR